MQEVEFQELDAVLLHELLDERLHVRSTPGKACQILRPPSLPSPHSGLVASSP